MKKLSVANLETVSRANKGLGNVQQLHKSGWNIAQQDVSLPCLCLYESRLLNNISWMADYTNQSHVLFAPHGKTTMTPAIFKKQLAAGAYAITVATTAQAVAAVTSGAERVLMANQLVGRANYQQLDDLLSSNEIVFYCLVDNLDNVRMLGEYFANTQHTIHVLIELGVPDGRCGVVNSQLLAELIAEIAKFDSLALAGIEVYEGVLGDPLAVSQFLEYAVATCKQLIADNAFDTKQVMITAGGSAYYDLVCEAFHPDNLTENMLAVLRPGCYVTHDQGIYEQAQQQILARNELACSLGSELTSCLEIWAYVQSMPEPGRAIIGFGKRDAAFDAGFPIPTLHVDQQGQISAANSNWKIEKMMDQHAMMKVPNDTTLRVGDMVAFATSHPCLTFDKWRYINVIDDNYNVVDVVETYF